jgi:hypothetical protein
MVEFRRAANNKHHDLIRIAQSIVKTPPFEAA